MVNTSDTMPARAMGGSVLGSVEFSDRSVDAYGMRVSTTSMSSSIPPPPPTAEPGVDGNGNPLSGSQMSSLPAGVATHRSTSLPPTAASSMNMQPPQEPLQHHHDMGGVRHSGQLMGQHVSQHPHSATTPPRIQQQLQRGQQEYDYQQQSFRQYQPQHNSYDQQQSYKQQSYNGGGESDDDYDINMAGDEYIDPQQVGRANIRINQSPQSEYSQQRRQKQPNSNSHHNYLSQYPNIPHRGTPSPKRRSTDSDTYHTGDQPQRTMSPNVHRIGSGKYDSTMAGGDLSMMQFAYGSMNGPMYDQDSLVQPQQSSQSLRFSSHGSVLRESDGYQGKGSSAFPTYKHQPVVNPPHSVSVLRSSQKGSSIGSGRGEH